MRSNQIPTCLLILKLLSNELLAELPQSLSFNRVGCPWLNTAGPRISQLALFQIRAVVHWELQISCK